MDIRTEYLNRTVNKSARPDGCPSLLCCVWHETGGLNRSALDWNLKAYHVIKGQRYNVYSSYNYHIDRQGVIDWYVDESRYIAWHAGKAGIDKSTVLQLAGKTYRGFQVNQIAIGIELEGMNDGTPITTAQRDSGVWLALHLNERYGILLHDDFHIEHHQLAPGYKTDGKGYSAAMLIELARKVQA